MYLPCGETTEQSATWEKRPWGNRTMKRAHVTMLCLMFVLSPSTRMMVQAQTQQSNTCFYVNCSGSDGCSGNTCQRTCTNFRNKRRQIVTWGSSELARADNVHQNALLKCDKDWPNPLYYLKWKECRDNADKAKSDRYAQINRCVSDAHAGNCNCNSPIDCYAAQYNWSCCVCGDHDSNCG